MAEAVQNISWKYELQKDREKWWQETNAAPSVQLPTQELLSGILNQL